MNPGNEKSFLLSCDSDYVLSSKFDIELVLTMIQELEDRAQFFKDLKQYRTKILDEQIKDLTSQSDKLRGIVLKTMQTLEPQKKTLSFPGVGKVTRSSLKGKWEIQDESTLLGFLKSEGLTGQVVETKDTIIKKEANKVFDCFKDQKKSVPGVVYQEGKETVSISFEEASESNEKTESAAKTTASKIAISTINDSDV